jgi:hypothetical protein
MKLAYVFLIVLIAPAVSMAAHGHFYISAADNALVLTNAVGDPIALTNADFPSNQFGGAYAGFAYGAPATLTTLEFAATLGPGDIGVEITSVTPLSGSPVGNVVGWSIPLGTDGINTFPATNAISSAGTVEGRSLELPVGWHVHGQTLYSQLGGAYEVTLVAHDLRTDVDNRFADSAPMTFTFTAVPEPAGIAFTSALGLLAIRRRR